MRTIFFSLLLLITINSAHSQDDWAPIGAKWYFSSPDVLGDPLKYVVTYESVADTVINGQSCRKIVYGNNRALFMYGDSQKVYLWQYNQWYLVYDFSLNLNDTIVLMRNAIIDEYPEDTVLNITMTVNTIDSVFVNDFYLKKFTMLHIPLTEYPTLQFFGEYYIEKIGNIWNFINIIAHPLPIGDSIININLRCYEDTSLHFIAQHWSYYWNTYGLPCDYTGPLNVPLSFNKAFSIYPNPAENVININSEYDCKLFIRNIFGKTIKEIQVFEGYNIVEINDMSVGILFLEMNNKSNRQYFKIIKL